MENIELNTHGYKKMVIQRLHSPLSLLEKELMEKILPHEQ
jgi:hypothetical protein